MAGPSAVPPGPATVAPSASSPPLAPSAAPSAAPPSVPGAATLAGRVRIPTTFISDQGGGLVGNNGAAVVANNGASIIGVNGTGLVSDQGGGLIGVNGGGVVANGGGRYRLAATVAQVPLGGLTVRLVDAAGQPVRDAAGQPMQATTDGEGRYAFTAPLPARNLVLAASLPAGLGELQAIVPRDGAGGRQVDADLVSTLTTAYILDRYVRTQAEPLATIERLPADVEAATRQRAAAALDAAALGAPKTLATGVVGDVVAVLRQADPAFDAQLETVKRLLVAAGQSDLGNGRPALEVSLGHVGDVLANPDGSFYIACSSSHRVWRLGADGRLATAAGNGTPTMADIAGKRGEDAGIASPFELVPDGRGGVWIVEAGVDFGREGNRLSHLLADGRIEEAWKSKRPDEAVAGAWAAPDGGVLAWVDGPDGASLWQAGATGPARFLRRMPGYPGEPPPALATPDYGNFRPAFATDGAGGRWLIPQGARLALFALDAAAEAFTPAAPALPPGFFVRQGFSMDAAGRVFLMDAARKLTMRLPDGTTRTVADPLPPAIRSPWGHQLGAATLDADGALVVAVDDVLYRVKGGVATAIAGTKGAAGGVATETALVEPQALAFRPDGTMIIADLTGEAGGNTRFYQRDAAGRLTLVRRLGVNRTGFHLAADGGLILQGYEAVLAIAPDGTSRERWNGMPERSSQVAVGPDGTLTIMARHVDETTLPRLFTLAPDGATRPLALPPESTYLAAMMADAEGLWAMDGPRLWLLPPGGAWKLVANDDQLDAFDNPGGLTRDARGRVYVANPWKDMIVVVDPADPVPRVLAGAGGTFFNGEGVELSVSMPRCPRFAPDGDLYFADSGHKQIKRIPGSQL